MCDYDETQAIGRRYRRQDELGTPYCVTVDFDSLEDQAVTVRERDSMEQAHPGRRPGRPPPGAPAERAPGGRRHGDAPEPTEDDWLGQPGHGDERVPIHGAPTSTGSRSSRPRSTLHPFEVAELGPVRDRELVHLQCHFGLDTLSGPRGARVTGLDFSEPAVEAGARPPTSAIPARFSVRERLRRPPRCSGPPLRRRRERRRPQLAARRLAVGRDRRRACPARAGAPTCGSHPVADVFADEELTVAHDHFADPEPLTWEDAAPTPTPTPPRSTTAPSVAAPGLRGALGRPGQGLHLDLFHEQPFTVYARWPFLERHDDGTFWMPEDRPVLLLMYTLRATKVG